MDDLCREQLDRLAEVFRVLPEDARQRLMEDVAEYAAVREQAYQLSLSLGKESQDEAAVLPVEQLDQPSTHNGGHRKHVIVFGWYGGKFSHLNWLLPLLPPAHHYCEPFGGSAAVLLNRDPSPVETYNDLDGQVANFFRVLRDQTEALLKAIALTPFSREEFALAIAQPDGDLPSLERARRFFVRARQVRTGLAQTASIGRWANCKQTSRAGMAGVVSRWLGSVEDLPEVAARLLRVQIENRPAIEVIRLYDSPDTLFYCDPPYPHESRGDSKAYKYEMTATQHIELASVLAGAKGKVAISGYHGDLMDELYRSWRFADAPVKNCHSVKKPRQETVWMNYLGTCRASSTTFSIASFS